MSEFFCYNIKKVLLLGLFMKKILVASDTHGNNRYLKDIIERNAHLDMFIFCGDGEGLERDIKSLVGNNCELYMVRGNNDYFSELPDELEFELGGERAFLTHGHKYGVSITTDHLIDEAEERGCRYVFYGHTHRPDFTQKNGILCINPGSLSYPRQFDRNHTFTLIEEDDRGELHFSMSSIEV